MRKTCKLLTLITLLISTWFLSFSASAIEITRYVSATGTGTGENPSNPTSNLEAVLKMGRQVDAVNIYITDGIYDIDGTGMDEPPYCNIRLTGVKDFETKENSNEVLPVIKCPNASFSRSCILNVSFGGSLSLGDSHFSNLTAKKNIYIYLNQGETLNVSFVSCAAFTFYLSYGTANVELYRCSADGGRIGVEGENVNIDAYGCEFANCTLGGAVIKNGKVRFNNCRFMDNKGYGGAFIWTLDDKSVAEFIDCSFCGNFTDDRDHGAGLTVLGTGAALSNCVFENNSGYGKLTGSEVGAFRCNNANFYIENCLFMDNAGAIRTHAYPQEASKFKEQVVNTAFFHNRTDIIAPNGFNVTRSHCATDKGSGIPELDREQGLIVVNGIVACGEDPNDKFLGIVSSPDEDRYIMAANSSLINAGKMGHNMFDRYSYFRNTLGGTDIGPVEYTGDLKPDYTRKPFIFDGEPYYFVTTTYNGKEHGYLAKIPEGLTVLDHLPYRSLYIGEMSAPPVQYGNSVLSWQNIDGQDYLLFFKKVYDWIIDCAIPYTGAKPVIKKSQAQKNKLVITANGQNHSYEY